MKDIEELKKLFADIKIPITEHHKYYIDTLMKSPFYAGIENVVKEFQEYEIDVIEEGYKSAKSYKLDYALPMMKNYILNTNAYERLQSMEIIAELRTKDDLRNNDDTYLISIDFKAANYNSLRTLDQEGELYNSWEELCEALGIH